ncbi:hypothetical protein CEXT_244691 [Caerostris extrusa]|uniref:NADP-dependent oxidoreductase domain-containing protein n=1 Tax=Caerostris extrusa TaxID=172846 RepID=A0AAV4XGH3_CAEEX|nr:hypothetical protein CEXT_244691 [Caerostris extrusa]
MWSRLLAINGKICGFVYSQRGMAFKNPTLKLSSGHSMPTVGLGTVKTTALDAGYRHLDTAYVYQSEKLIGEVLKDVLDTASAREGRIVYYQQGSKPFSSKLGENPNRSPKRKAKVPRKTPI